MRVTDLIPWRAERRDRQASSDGGDPVSALQANVNRAFDDFLRMFPMPLPGGLGNWPTTLLEQGGAFQVDVQQTDKEVKITAELPGVEEGDIDVRVSDGMLTIAAEKKSGGETERDGFILRERSIGRVERTLPLPDGVDADAAQASFKNGVLTVTIPKTSQAQADTKRIPVQSS
ncbi:MAG TPA: Hsp20/alpha crystallin family protein [Acetobacteraceae bacterium]|nr:Hsp20/alpha crystallin family protein [Acetobacteraceae bacterium]